MAVPYTFGSATSAIPLSQLDSNFNTTITLGNTAIQLGNTVTTLNNMTFANVTISSVSTPITVAQGGTGLTSFTANGVVYASSTSALATGSALTFDGTNLATTGTATATRFIPSGSTVATNGMYLPAANSIGISTNSTNAVYIDSSQNVGVGTSSPSTYNGKLNVKTSDQSVIGYFGGTTYASRLGANSNYATVEGVDAATGVSSYQPLQVGGSLLSLATGGTERARFTSAGEFWVAGTTDQGAYNIQCNGTGVWGAGAYVNGSDARIKDNIEPLQSSLDTVAKLNPVTFQYKKSWSKDSSTQPGFIAQELQAALADTNYANGVVQQGPKYMSVAYQTLIPVLTKAIQELSAKVETLEAQLAAKG